MPRFQVIPSVATRWIPPDSPSICTYHFKDSHSYVSFLSFYLLHPRPPLQFTVHGLHLHLLPLHPPASSVHPVVFTSTFTLRIFPPCPFRYHALPSPLFLLALALRLRVCAAWRLGPSGFRPVFFLFLFLSLSQHPRCVVPLRLGFSTLASHRLRVPSPRCHMP